MKMMRLQQERLRVIKNQSNEDDGQRLQHKRLREIENRSNETDDQRSQRLESLEQDRLCINENRSRTKK